MKRLLVGLVVVVIIAGGLAAYWYFRADALTETPVTAAAPLPPVTLPGLAPEMPAIEHPLPEPLPGEPALPALVDSDRAVTDLLTGLFGQEAFARFFLSDDIVRRFVATIDNLPRKTAAQRLLPTRPVPGGFVVQDVDGGFVATLDNELRYRPYVLAMEQVEARRLVAAYLRHYPLFQAAYQELGYPDGYFNDRLMQAIDDLLAAPDAPNAVLTQPRILYQFADASLEERSAGQKIILRMGAANAGRVKDKLRAIRRELVAQETQR
jgi:hypothetical protein